MGSRSPRRAQATACAALFLNVALAFYQLKELDRAEEYYIRARSETDDGEVARRSSSLLADLYLERKEYIKAEREYKEILESDPGSADAYFGLGEVYRLSGTDVSAARRMYREALRLNPSHVGAALQYYGR